MGKIALGTAQFGNDYGINNKRGKIPGNEIFEILNEALKNKIDTLDTAYSYGDSENIIGDFIKSHKRCFNIISKLPKCSSGEVEQYVLSSLKRLNINSFYGYLIHDFKQFSNDPQILDAMKYLKGKGKIKKIGVSLYYPKDLETIFENNIEIDIVQFPYSIFDQRFTVYFSKLKNLRVKIHIRSVFLQGLLFKNIDNIGKHFNSIRNKIKNLHNLADESKVPLVSLLLNFAILNEYIDKVVVGIDNLQNFREIIGSNKFIKDVAKIIERLYEFKEDDENIILPFNWKLGVMR